MGTDYDTLSKQIECIIDEEPFYVSAMANISELLWETLPDLNWAGFYIVRDGRLSLGPFQGKVACIHIDRGKGVCGTSWSSDETCVVGNVHEFPGHIACDSASNSEIVIPVHCNGTVAGVLDLDSPLFSRFSPDDRKGLEMIVKLTEEKITW